MSRMKFLPNSGTNNCTIRKTFGDRAHNLKQGSDSALLPEGVLHWWIMKDRTML